VKKGGLHYDLTFLQSGCCCLGSKQEVRGKNWLFVQIDAIGGTASGLAKNSGSMAGVCISSSGGGNWVEGRKASDRQATRSISTKILSQEKRIINLA